jgi:hypothetical protein
MRYNDAIITFIEETIWVIKSAIYFCGFNSIKLRSSKNKTNAELIVKKR